MKILPLILILFKILEINNAFDLSKKYFSKSKILPISNKNCKKLCYEWKDIKNANQKKICNFENNIDNKNSIIYKYIPHRKNNVKALLIAQVNLNKNELTFIDILSNPKFKLFDNKLLEYELYNLNKKFKKYKELNIKIEYNPNITYNKNFDFKNYLYSKSIRY